MAARFRAAGRGEAPGKLSARVRQIAWTLDYLDDIRSDFSVLHRVDEVERMAAPRFFAYCYRLSAYQGVIAAEARRTQTARDTRPSAQQVSLSEWAAAHPEEMAAAAETWTGKR